MTIGYRAMLLDEGYSAEQIKDFLAWHEQNAWAWRWYDVECLKEIRLGAKRISSKLLFEKMRSEFRREINNNYTAMFARIWAHKHPEFKDRFEFRTITACRGKNEIERRAEDARGNFNLCN